MKIEDACGEQFDCYNPHCKHHEPHPHGLLCEAACSTCEGYGLPVKDPENHPNHEQWLRPCTCAEGLGRCRKHHHPDDFAAMQQVIVGLRATLVAIRHMAERTPYGTYPIIENEKILDIIEKNEDAL